MGFLLLSGGAYTSVLSPVIVQKEVAVASHTVTLTAYNAVSEQTDADPLTTASGAYSNPEIVAARSRNLADELPFGTIIEIDGPTAAQNTCGYGVVAPIIGYRVIADTMNARFTDRIDVLFSTDSNYVQKNGNTKNAGMILGICSGATIRVVGHVDVLHMPKTQIELAKIVRGSDSALALK